MLHPLRCLPPSAIVVADAVDFSVAVAHGNGEGIISAGSKCARNGFRLLLGIPYALFRVVSVMAGFVEPVTGTASKGE